MVMFDTSTELLASVAMMANTYLKPDTCDAKSLSSITL